MFIIPSVYANFISYFFCFIHRALYPDDIAYIRSEDFSELWQKVDILDTDGLIFYCIFRDKKLHRLNDQTIKLFLYLASSFFSILPW